MSASPQDCLKVESFIGTVIEDEVAILLKHGTRILRGARVSIEILVGPDRVSARVVECQLAIVLHVNM